MAALSTDVSVLVVGAGTMGSGIAQVAALAGHYVAIFDARHGAACSAIDLIRRSLDRRVKAGKLDPDFVDATCGRISAIDALGDAHEFLLIIEAIKEDLAAKQELFRHLETITGPDCILATNTSSLSVTAIGSVLTHPGRLVGMHFFNPAHMMPLVEVIAGLETSPAVVRVAADTAAAWGRQPVHVRSTPGFIVNRVARPFYAEGLRVLQEGGGNPATLDAVMRDSGGFRMGPFELMDLIGHDVNFAVTRSLHAAYFGDPRYSPSIVQQELVDGGRLGRKSGRGFYVYTSDAAMPEPETMALAPGPGRIVVQGRVDGHEPLLDALRAAGVAIVVKPCDGRWRMAIDDGPTLSMSDGRSATERAAAEGIRDLVLWDLVIDWRRATRIAIAAASQASPSALVSAAGLFQAAAKNVTSLADVPGLIVTRTVAMLANEAVEAVSHGVASAADIDAAMQLGVGYPRGPLAWADSLGPANVLEVLDQLARTYGEDRYRASALLRRCVASGSSLQGIARAPMSAARTR